MIQIVGNIILLIPLCFMIKSYLMLRDESKKEEPNLMQIHDKERKIELIIQPAVSYRMKYVKAFILKIVILIIYNGIYIYAVYVHLEHLDTIYTDPLIHRN